MTADVHIGSMRDEQLAEAEKLMKDYPEIFSVADMRTFRTELLEHLLERTAHKKTMAALTLCTNDALTGIIVFSKEELSSTYYKIRWLIVRRDQQGKGYGSLLMKNAFQHISREGGTYAYLQTSAEKHNERTKRFYERLGFVPGVTLPNFFAPPLAIRKRPEDTIFYYKQL